jgi:hypothetical protein
MGVAPPEDGRAGGGGRGRSDEDAEAGDAGDEAVRLDRIEDQGRDRERSTRETVTSRPSLYLYQERHVYNAWNGASSAPQRCM